MTDDVLQPDGREPAAGTGVYLGIFLVALATVMFEILLTRIFSVTMWYHFAFFCVSLAMFGMTFGAVLVYVFPGFFVLDRTLEHLAKSSRWFSLTMVFALMTHLSLPVSINMSAISVFSLILTYVVLAIPFIFSGICVCLVLSRFPREVGRLYAADLFGAALSCALVVVVMRLIDGPSAVLFAAVIAAAGSCSFAFRAAGGERRRAAAACVLLLLLAGVSALSSAGQNPLLKLQWVKGELERPLAYEKWNSFSRIAVRPIDSTPRGSGLSLNTPPHYRVDQYWLDIDAGAATILSRFDGRLDPFEFLRYDVTNIAHYVRPDSKLLVIGSGGGRDVLSGLVFKQPEILAVEINEEILNTVNRRFGSFTGHLDKLPNVRFVNDEARSFIARSQESFDLIQISLIDTWAATAAGALALTENSLYTVEAWKTMLEHLSARGVLSVSRWYSVLNPMETQRTLALAQQTLAELGIKSSDRHIMAVTNVTEGFAPDYNGQVTILVSKEPFTEADVQTIQETAARMRFTVLAAPGYARDAAFRAIVSGQGLDQLKRSLPYNLSAPTDDNPFFFNLLRLQDLFRSRAIPSRLLDSNAKAVGLLYLLLAITVLLTYYTIVYPLRRRTRTGDKQALRLLTLYFLAIGLGYMLVEISQMQRLAIFLGHPVYSLSVVLFALLLATSAGSASMGAFLTRKPDSGTAVLSLLLIVLIAFGLASVPLIEEFRSASTATRILVALLLVLPLGYCMGAAFPLGMSLAHRSSSGLEPWLWGVNGAASVVSSVFAAVLALSAGVSAAFWAGAGCYAGALLVCRLLGRQRSAAC